MAEFLGNVLVDLWKVKVYTDSDFKLTEVSSRRSKGGYVEVRVYDLPRQKTESAKNGRGRSCEHTVIDVVPRNGYTLRSARGVALELAYKIIEETRKLVMNYIAKDKAPLFVNDERDWARECALKVLSG